MFQDDFVKQGLGSRHPARHIRDVDDRNLALDEASVITAEWAGNQEIETFFTGIPGLVVSQHASKNSGVQHVRNIGAVEYYPRTTLVGDSVRNVQHVWNVDAAEFYPRNVQYVCDTGDAECHLRNVPASGSGWNVYAPEFIPNVNVCANKDVRSRVDSKWGHMSDMGMSVLRGDKCAEVVKSPHSVCSYASPQDGDCCRLGHLCRAVSGGNDCNIVKRVIDNEVKNFCDDDIEWCGRLINPADVKCQCNLQLVNDVQDMLSVGVDKCVLYKSCGSQRQPQFCWNNFVDGVGSLCVSQVDLTDVGSVYDLIKKGGGGGGRTNQCNCSETLLSSLGCTICGEGNKVQGEENWGDEMCSSSMSVKNKNLQQPLRFSCDHNDHNGFYSEYT